MVVRAPCDECEVPCNCAMMPGRVPGCSGGAAAALFKLYDCRLLNTCICPDLAARLIFLVVPVSWLVFDVSLVTELGTTPTAVA
jgi:hypothetical protein